MYMHTQYQMDVFTWYFCTVFLVFTRRGNRQLGNSSWESWNVSLEEKPHFCMPMIFFLESDIPSCCLTTSLCIWLFLEFLLLSLGLGGSQQILVSKNRVLEKVWSFLTRAGIRWSWAEFPGKKFLFSCAIQWQTRSKPVPKFVLQSTKRYQNTHVYTWQVQKRTVYVRNKFVQFLASNCHWWHISR